jgi:hypothetical protein
VSIKKVAVPKSNFYSTRSEGHSNQSFYFKVTSKEIQTASLESCRKISKYLQIPTVRRRLIKSVRPTHTAMRPNMCGNISKNAADGTERSIFTTTNKIYCQNIFLNCSSSFSTLLFP